MFGQGTLTPTSFGGTEMDLLELIVADLETTWTDYEHERITFRELRRKEKDIAENLRVIGAEVMSNLPFYLD